MWRIQLVNISVGFTDSLTADDLELSISSMDKSIKESYPQVKRIFIEAEKMFADK